MSFHTPFAFESCDSNCSCDSLRINELDALYGNVSRSHIWCGDVPPSDFISSTSVIQVVFKTDSSQTYAGFNASWTEIVPCGGHFQFQDKGLLQSPNYPSFYNQNQFCKWTVRVEDGFLIRLVFYSPFGVDSCSTNCNCSSLKVYDVGKNGEKTQMGLWCGHIPPPDFVSTTSTIVLELQTGDSNTDIGFVASWSTIVCGTSFKYLDKGILQSPNYPFPYDNNQFCRWDIIVEDGFVIKLSFDVIFELQPDLNCAKDNVTVFEIDEHDQRTQKAIWCGNITGPNFISSTSHIEVEFKSDNFDAYKGFRASWSKLTVCGDKFHLTDTGIIESPNFPSSHNYDQFCKWNITVQNGFVVKLSFDRLFELQDSLSCANESVKIFEMSDNGRKIQKAILCGGITPTDFVSSTSSIEVEFVTDGAGNHRGFKATWSKTTTCSDNFHFVNRGILQSTSPMSSNKHARFCKWNITVHEGYQIKLMLYSPSQSQICSQVKATIFEIAEYAQRVQKLSWCGGHTQSEYLSSSSSVEVEYTSMVPAAIFTASWSKVASCGWNFEFVDNGFLQIPNHIYFNGETFCKWNIRVKNNFLIKISFASNDQSAQCISNSLKIVDIQGNGHRKQHVIELCGESRLPDFVSSSSNLEVEFEADRYNLRRKLLASWSKIEYCGGRLLATQGGTFHSPNHPSNYNVNDICKWTITAEDGYVVKLIFQSPVSLEKSPGCYLESIRVYDIRRDGNRRESAKWCGDSYPDEYVSSASNVEIEFKSHGPNAHSGFNVSYVQIPNKCNQILNGMEGSVELSNYSYQYPFDEYCQWEITAPPDMFLTIHFMSFDMGIKTDGKCNHDRLEIVELSGGGKEFIRGVWCGKDSPGNIKSFGSKIRIVSQPDRNRENSGTGFTLQWKAVSFCGGVFDQTEGSFVSESNLFSNRSCTWEIHVPSIYHMLFKIHFGNETINCQDMKIFEYSESEDKFLPQTNWCEADNAVGYQEWQTSHNRIKIFTSGYGSQAFKATWSSICGNTFHAKRGRLVSPNYPHDYENNVSCMWEIIAKDKHIINIEFDSNFEIERSAEGCTNDYVEIFDVVKGQLRSKGRFCGTGPQSPLVSYFTNVVIVFFSDGSKTGRGFSLSWNSNDTCGEFLNRNQGSLEFPGLRNTIPYDTECVWKIQVDQLYNGIDITFGGNISTIGHFKLMEITNDESVGRVWTSYYGTALSTSTDTVLLHFAPKIDGLLTNGFRMSWNAICGRNYIHRGKQGQLTSPNYSSDYPPNFNCTWIIQARKQHSLHLTFDPLFQVENSGNGSCNYDYVDIYDGSNRMGRFCGSKAPPKLESSSNWIKVFFHSDREKNAKGFSLSWLAVCGGVHSSKNGSLKSPNYPGHYPNNADCRWEIRANEGYAITLTFGGAFDLQNSDLCESDYVEVYDILQNGQEVNKGRWCGLNMPSQQTSVSHRMAVVFHSDASHEYRGFEAVWDSSCGDIFANSSGEFTSPGYPNHEPNNLKCPWEIHVTPGQRVMLQFEFEPQHDGEQEQSYCYDKIDIMDSFSNGTWISRGKPCISGGVANMISFSSFVKIIFNSGDGPARKGFSASWTSISGCGGRLNGSEGYLMTPNYPSNYPQDVQCVWEIRPDPEHTEIDLTFDPLFDVELSKTCSYDNVYFKTRDDEFGPWCGQDAPSRFSVNATVLSVFFSSDKRDTGRGFYLSWTRSQE